MKKQKFLIFIFLLPFLAWHLPSFVTGTDDYSDLVISNLDEARSRLLMVDGNMYFHAGKSKNITFRVSDGASILFGKTDILSLPNSTQIAELQNMINKHIQNVDAWNTMFSTLQTQIYDSKTEATHMVYEIKLIKQNITSLIKARKGSGRTNARLRKLLTMVNENISKVVKMIQTDECQQYPCQNGGTCIDLVSKYQCLCPTHFDGKDCDTRVDECELYAKTHLGCQNNATCSNNGILPGFTCHCPKGYHGRRCQMKSTSCDHSLDLCGEHGHCMPGTDDTYKCLCEFGYKSDEDPSNPTCVDVDECSEKPCHPGAQCINLPGGFKCSSCPVGLQGNGINCFDIDECREDMANECSKNPKVQCLNTWGSYHCGPCPAGWEGDGKTCTKTQETCDDDPCHPKATCTQNPDVVCTCEDGYEGDGRGENGCKRVLTDEEKSCDVEGCRNGGTCVTSEDGGSYCSCAYGFEGPHCEKYDVCRGNPCGENGKCLEFNGLRKCECNPGYYGIVCQNQEDTCGFHTHNETGIIEYSRSTKYVELRDSVCQWTIQLFDTRKIIEFRFENFSIPKLYSLTSKGCRFGFANLTIHDGPTADQPLIGGFCHGDNNVPDTNVPFYTSGNAAKLMFYLRLHSGSTYLKMSWKALEPRCGGRITQSSGTITYYDVHDDDICAWYISVPPQYHIELTLKSAKMASGTSVNCSINSLELFDHQSAANRTRLIEVCENQQKPLIFRTTVPYATVYFKTNRKLMDNNVPILDCKKDSTNPWCGVGFVLSYKTLELPAGCGGTIIPDENGKMEGYIESPGYGHSYFPNLSCQWILNATVENNTLPVAESARKVQIEFIDFDIATSETKYISTLSHIAQRVIQNCGGDFVRVSPRGGMFCNLMPPKGMYSSNYFEIKLSTDSSVGGRGFRLKYQNVCEMDFTAKNGTISSPNYPTASTTPFKCSYRIIAAPHQAIRVIFRYIGLRTDVNTCFYNSQRQKESNDYIEIQGGHKSNEQINRRYVCARYPFVSPYGEIITSGITPLSITYSTSGDSDSNTGFSFDYEIFDVGCGGLYYQSTGTIKSPNFPERYHPHMYCIYEIIVAWDQRVRLNFDVFDVENVANQDDCGFDNVQVYDGTYVNEDDHGELLGRFCGMSKPPALLSKSNKMSVVFLSDRSVNGEGFSATYRGVEAADDCDQTFTNIEGIIEFNSTKHPRATRCNYVIVLPRMHRIMLTFENLTISCNQGSLIPRNGMSMDSPAFPGVPNLCDSKSLPQLITQGNRAYLQFSTTAPESTHFRLKYEQFAAGCGGKITGISGFISAPQYPLKDSRSLNCDWSISVGEGNRVKLSFSFIDNLDSADTRGDCNSFGANYIDVSDGPYADYSLIKRFCSKQVNTLPIVSESNQISVKYVQHGGSYHGALFGFLAHFDTKCDDIVLTDHHGSIQSPGFPGPIEGDTKLACKYTIRTTPGSRIALQFHRFEMKSKDTGLICSNYLMIPSSQVQNITATGVAPTFQNTRFCEYYNPQEIISKNNTLTLEYSLRGSRSDNVFWVSWTTLGCGGIILRNSSEMIVSQSDFTSDKEERQCQWVIKAPLGFVAKVFIEFGYFMNDLEHKEACDDPSKTKDPKSHDGIEFYAGTDNSSGVPQKIFCGQVNNQSWTSQTNEVFAFMSVASQNAMSKNGVILKAKVEFVKLENDASCGGIITLDDDTPTFIHSPNYPKAYPKGISCIWEFHAPNGSLVAFNLTEFNNPSGNRRHYYSSFDGITQANCTASMAYLEGSLAFYEGSYNASEAYIRSNRMMHRVCLQIDKYRILTSRSQKVVVVFHGSPQELSQSSSSDDKTQKQNGFMLKAWAKCGGTLTAKRESQSFIIANANDENPNSLRFNCTYRFVKDPEDEDEGDTLYIRGERLPYSDISPRANALDQFTFQCNDEDYDNFVDFKQDLSLEKDFGECDGSPVLMTDITELSGKYLINYGLESQFCGGIIDQFQKHIKFRINKRKPADCEWQFKAPYGFRVNLHVDLVRLPESELCQESFIEIRQSSANESEERICSFEEKIRNYASPEITVRLRYHPNEDRDDEALDEIMGDYTLQMKSTIEVDVFPQSNIIESPPAKVMAQPLMYWLIQAKENNTKIRITFDRLNVSPYSTTILTLTPTQCTYDEECSTVLVEGYIEDGTEPRVYYFNSKEVKVEWGKTENIGSFRLKWEEIDENEYRESVRSNSTQSSNDLEIFNCGGELYPTYETKTLQNPKNFFGKYLNDQRCKWTINRKRFSNVIVKITYLDLEEQTSCQYDYVGIGILDLTATELLSTPAGMLTYCKGNTSLAGMPMELEYHQNVYIYFVTDRSRTGTGFKIEYKLGCRSFDYITDTGVPLKAEITSPNWPLSYRRNESCFWGVILGSTRQLKVTAELDIDGSDGSCGGDWFLMEEIPTAIIGSTIIGGQKTKRCGQISYEKTFNGRLYAYFTTDNTETSRKGFKLTLEEVVVDCSSTSLWIDERTPKKFLTSPEFPHMSPNSLNCYWVIHTLPGHRVKFTVEHSTFNVQSDSMDECIGDYLEIHDGPSEASPLVGRYCHTTPPSTIFSSDSSLFVRYVTDYDIHSMGFNATYEVASCGGSVVLQQGHASSVTSPNFPDPYPPTETCEWNVHAPRGHFVMAEVEHIWMSYSENCTMDYLMLRDNNSTGDVLMPPTCSKLQANLDGYQSMHDSMYVQFHSNSSSGIKMSRMFCTNRECGFNLKVSSTAFECGGEIDDDEGTIVLPGYPDRIIPHLSCEWTFKAGMGHRYALTFAFLNKENGFYLKSFTDHCYPDLEIFNGPPIVKDSLLATEKRFCQNRTSFVSMADLATLTYQDQLRYSLTGFMRQRSIMDDRLSKPWKITYRKITDRFNNEGCSSVISRNMVMKVGNLSLERGSSYGLGARSFCHLQVKRPEGTTGTTVISFTEMKPRNSIFKNCAQGNRVIVTENEIGPWKINEVVCNISKNSNETVLILPNSIFDIYVVNNPHKLFTDSPLEFKLGVKFYPCGGTILEDEAEDQTGLITSPNFEQQGVYNKNDNCLWFLRASEGKTIELEFDFMDIEYHLDCKNDHLIVAEGEGINQVIQRYCYSLNETLPERFRKIRTRGRDLTLLWQSDGNIQKRGFNLTYSFIHYHSDTDNGCGFSSHAMTGVIESPHYPKDYPNNVQCIWDIVVPFGYNVKLTFEKFDLQLSDDCKSDYVQISQEHQSRALAPLGDYYFYFEHEEILHTYCGTTKPTDVHSESNRIRLNFTSDDTLTGKGFKATWKAECGATLSLTHGVITSPHYPKYYPNADFECNYLIYPALPNNEVPIVVLKLLDFDMSTPSFPWRSINAETYGGRFECIRDYLEIIDVVRGRTVAKYCQENMQATTSAPPISIRGGVGVRFVGNQSYFEGNEMKRHRGFKISYALADCGGELKLTNTMEGISGTITSPGFPLPYHNNLDCVWNITAPEDRIISAKFTNVEMELNYNSCEFDFVELYDGIQSNFSTTPNATNGLMGRYCGEDTPTDYLITTTPNMTIRFHSDHSSSKGGFKLVLTATLGPLGGCGGNLIATDEVQTLAPPLVDGKYANGLRCLWSIKTKEPSKVIEMKFTKMNIENRKRVDDASLTGCYDFVAIYDGPRALSSFLLQPTCEFPDLPVKFISSYRHVDFYFESDVADGFDGFNVEYKTIPDECGKMFEASFKSGEYAYVSASGLTRENQQHQRCRFFFFAREGQPIELEFTQFNYPSTDPTCPQEFLEIRDVGNPAECTHPACSTKPKTPTNMRFCRKNMPTRFVSQTSVIQITSSILVQSEYVSSFTVSYKVLDQCNRTVTFEPGSHFASGRLTSPNYPNSYENNATCITSISAPADYKILIVFKEFRVERGEGFRHRFPGVGGYNSPYWRRGGWSRISSSPFTYSRYTYSSICSYDSLTVNLNPTNSTSGQTFCGFTLPPSQFSKTNQLDLKFKTDDSMAHGGYDLSYYSVKPVLVSTKSKDTMFYEFEPSFERSGAITPVGFPSGYPNNTIQRFSIRPPSGLFCTFKMMSLSLTSVADLDNCDATDILRYKTVIATNDGGDEEHRDSNWISPCIPGDETYEFPKGKGLNYYFEFKSDDDNENNGAGFRIHWDCEDYTEEII